MGIHNINLLKPSSWSEEDELIELPNSEDTITDLIEADI